MYVQAQEILIKEVGELNIKYGSAYGYRAKFLKISHREREAKLCTMAAEEAGQKRKEVFKTLIRNHNFRIDTKYENALGWNQLAP